jgi:N-acyl-L-homoserine lactone synthetase
MSAGAGSSRQLRSSISHCASSENQFCRSVARLLDRIDCRRADAGEQQEAISRLRYRAYLREGAISRNSSETFSDPYDETDNAYVFGLYIEDELASSIRFHVASRERPACPSLEVFPDLLQPLLDAGNVIIDTTRFVVDENLARRHRALPYATLRLGWLASSYFGVDHCLAAIRVEHQAFYRRTFQHRLVGGPRPYPHLEKPICLMTVHYQTVADDVHRRYPFFRSTFFERRMLFERRPQQAKCHPFVESDIIRLAC